VQTGYRYAVSQGYALIARLDGDGQHDASCLGDLVAPLVTGCADMVVGSRFLMHQTYEASTTRAWGIRFFAALLSSITGQHFTDTTSGFLACNYRAASYLAQHLPPDYPEIEGLLMLSRAGYRIQEVGVRMRLRHAGASSIGRVGAFYYVFKVTLAVLMSLVR
jgi:hypothetical protein